MVHFKYVFCWHSLGLDYNFKFEPYDMLLYKLLVLVNVNQNSPNELLHIISVQIYTSVVCPKKFGVGVCPNKFWVLHYGCFSNTIYLLVKVRT